MERRDDRIQVVLSVNVKRAGRGSVVWGVYHWGIFRELPKPRGFKYRLAESKYWKSGEGKATAMLRKGETVYIIAGHGSQTSGAFLCVNAVVRLGSKLVANAESEDGLYEITAKATNLKEKTTRTARKILVKEKTFRKR